MKINYRNRAINGCIADVCVLREQLEQIHAEMMNTPHEHAPCNETAIMNLWVALDKLNDVERLLETAKKYDPEAKKPEEKPPCYLCGNWKGTCKVDKCNFTFAG